MKHIVLAVSAAVCLSASAFAQTSAVTDAFMYRKDGNLTAARTEIDKAVVHEKTASSAKAWYFRGLIYEGLATDQKFKDKAPADALKTAYDSYQKSKDLDKKGGEYYTKSEAQMKAMYAPVFNAGVKRLQEEKFEEALESFAFAKTMKPSDSTLYLYSAYAAEGRAGKTDKNYALAKENYYKVIELSPRSKETYQRLLYITRDLEGNDEEALKVSEAALKQYPNDKDFLLAEVNLFIKAKRQDEAIAKLEKAISVDPKNPNLYAALGSLYDGIKNTEKALTNYSKAIEMDPKNFDAQYNMGVYQYNKAADLYLKMDAMDYATYQKKGKALEEEAKKYFAQASGYFERALEIQPNEVPAMETLRTIYAKLGRAEDAKKMTDRINAVKKGTPAPAGGGNTPQAPKKK